MTAPRCILCQTPLAVPPTADSFCSPACVELLEQRAFGYVARTQQFTTAQFRELLQIPILRDWAREIVWHTARTSSLGHKEFIVVEDYTLADETYSQVLLPDTVIRSVYPPPVHWLEVLWELEIVPLNLKKRLLLDQVPFVQHSWLLENLVQHESQQIRRKLCDNPYVPAHWQTRFAQDSSKVVRRAVAQQPNTTPALLLQLAQDSIADVRKAVAGNPQTPLAILTLLLHDSDYRVRYVLTQHLALSVVAMAQLAQDEHVEVRRGLVNHPQLTLGILWQLARDADHTVRSYVAHRAAQEPLIPEILELLSDDENTNIAHYARHYLKKYREQP